MFMCAFRIWRGRVFIGAALFSAALQMFSTHHLIPAAPSVTVQSLSIRNNAMSLFPVYVCSLTCVCLRVCIRGRPNPCAKRPEMDRQGERVYHLHLQCEETKIKLSGNHFRRNKKKQQHNFKQKTYFDIFDQANCSSYVTFYQEVVVMMLFLSLFVEQTRICTRSSRVTCIDCLVQY